MLDFFALITGVGAASGLSYENDRLFIVSDNSNYLYEYHIESKTLNRHLLLDMDGQNEQVKKEQKLDIEAIAQRRGVYYLFPSGSGPNRIVQFAIDPNDFSSIVQHDVSNLYTSIRETFHISEEDFNIEGAIFHQDNLFLFNRGNGPNKMNGIIKVIEKEGSPSLTFTPITLPRINGQIAGFTDATLVDGKIFYLAAAEAGDSNYYDGEVSGSQVGVIDPISLLPEKAETLSLDYKFEGITLYQDRPSEYVFLLCDDPDNNENKSTIHQLRIAK